MKGYFDLVLEDESVVEVKTSASRWNESVLVRHLQVGTYVGAKCALDGGPAKVLVHVLVKTQKPQITEHLVERGEPGNRWWFLAAQEIERAIGSGIFPPNPGMSCFDCEYATKCAGWVHEAPSRRRSLPVHHDNRGAVSLTRVARRAPKLPVEIGNPVQRQCESSLQLGVFRSKLLDQLVAPVLRHEPTHALKRSAWKGSCDHGTNPITYTPLTPWETGEQVLGTGGAMDTDGQHYYFTHQAKCCVNETIWPACSGEGRLCCDTQCGAILRLPVTYLPKPFEPVQ